MTPTYDQWVADVDKLCREHLRCAWADLCGDSAPLENAYCDGDTPGTFVVAWAAKYDLCWFEDGDLVAVPATWEEGQE